MSSLSNGLEFAANSPTSLSKSFKNGIIENNFLPYEFVSLRPIVVSFAALVMMS